jgi:hypothetical protein
LVKEATGARATPPHKTQRKNIMNTTNKKIQEMEDLINSQNFESALFEAELIDDFMAIDAFCDLYENLPEQITDLIDGNNAEYEATFDREYWGSDSVVQIKIQACNKTWNTEIETWKEEKFYAEWCDKAEKAIWRHITQQPNFAAFDMAMRGKRV